MLKKLANLDRNHVIKVPFYCRQNKMVRAALILDSCILPDVTFHIRFSLKISKSVIAVFKE